MDSGATFSDNQVHRYKLWRIWDAAKPLMAFCMLNPSTADEIDNDPTIERCQRRAELMGFGGILVVNIFSYRATDPKELYTSIHSMDISPFVNDNTILEVAEKAKMFICGWGKHGKLYHRGVRVLDMLKYHDVIPYALKLNKDGSPAHPLYLKYDLRPTPINNAQEKL